MRMVRSRWLATPSATEILLVAAGFLLGGTFDFSWLLQV